MISLLYPLSYIAGLAGFVFVTLSLGKFDLFPSALALLPQRVDRTRPSTRHSERSPLAGRGYRGELQNG